MADWNYSLAVETTIDAAPATVWSTLTDQIGSWWPPHFFSFEGANRFVVEGRLGGRVYEDAGDGAGATWGTVVVWRPGVTMTWACEMYPGFGGPGRSFVSFEVAANGTGTVVRLTDAGLAPDGPAAKDSLEAGWAELLGHAKAYAENRR